MSFDLAFWYQPEPSGPARAAQIYEALSATHEVTGLVEQSPLVGDFYDAVVAVFPELGPDNVDDPPWASGIHHTAECVLVTISWSRRIEVTKILLPLASHHGLTAYDPQADLVQRPTGADITVVNESDQTFFDPSHDELRWMLDRLTSDNQFLIMRRTSEPAGEHYAQVRLDRPNHYDIEYRDGSPAQHYGAVARDLSTVHAVLVGWGAQQPGWRGGLSWRRVYFE
jgi:hypothetical protein